MLYQGQTSVLFWHSLICPCQQSVQNGLFQLQTLGISFFRCQSRKRILQPEQPGTEALTGSGKRIFSFLGRQCLQCCVKFSSCVCPAANYPNLFLQLVVPLVSVCMKPAREVFQKFFRMCCFAARLVLVQYNGHFCAAAGSVQPHVRLTGGDSFSTCKVVSSPCRTGCLHSSLCSTS